MTTELVELGFDLPASVGNFFKLDDPVRGKLDNTTYVLSGVIFYDVTSRVRGYSIKRGKSRQLDNYQAGVASVVLSNNDRAFDPTYTASPYYGQVIPKRELRITSNGVRQYTGLIDDWNLDYAPQGDSTASVAASDGFAKLANQTLTGGTATSQLPGARITSILDSVDVYWPSDKRSIDTGTITLGADVQAVDANVLNYLQIIETTESGRLFIDKSGNLVFDDANAVRPVGSSAINLADDGTGIKYTAMQVVYGSELLYNQTVIGSVIGSAGTAVANGTASQASYGIQTYTRTDLLMANSADVDYLARQLVTQYQNPEFRFEAVTIDLGQISTAEANQILGIEMGQLCNIKFTPNNIAPAIQKYAEVISISHSADTVRHQVTLGFSTLDYVPFILDDVVFGRLDSGQLG
jgi:hypothetical protein